MATSSPASSTSTTRAPRILALDFVRVYAAFLVVAVHVITQPVIYGNVLAEAFLTLLHVSREIFLLMTGLVLTYSTSSLSGGGWRSWYNFYKRRYPLILIPYVCWSLIYMWYNKVHLFPFSPFWSLLVSNLQTGSASFQLYFLILTIKLYAIFPLLRWILERTKRYHAWILIVSGILQLLITSAMQYGWWSSSQYITNWFAKPDTALISYQFFILAGCIAAFHLPELVNWTRKHLAVVLLLCFSAIPLALACYLWQLQAGFTTIEASAVFQPILVVESVAYTMGLFALGLCWQEKGARGKVAYALLADVSFGIYLSHVLVITILSQYAGQWGLLHDAYIAPDWLTIAVVLGVVTPLVYLISGAIIAIARKTPVSLFITGRKYFRDGPI